MQLRENEGNSWRTTANWKNQIMRLSIQRIKQRQERITWTIWESYLSLLERNERPGISQQELSNCKYMR